MRINIYSMRESNAVAIATQADPLPRSTQTTVFAAMANPKMTYPGFHHDKHGITTIGRVVLDSWVFGFLPETEDCAGWDLGQLQVLMEKVEAEWDKYMNLPSRLPPELQARHTALYQMAMEEARKKGWDPELGDDE
jgi:hypothetical protein